MIGKDSLWCKLLADVALSYPLYINTINTRPGRLKGEGSFSTAEGGVSHSREGSGSSRQVLWLWLSPPVFPSLCGRTHEAWVASLSHSIPPYSKHHPKAQLPDAPESPREMGVVLWTP